MVENSEASTRVSERTGEARATSYWQCKSRDEEELERIVYGETRAALWLGVCREIERVQFRLESLDVLPDERCAFIDKWKTVDDTQSVSIRSVQVYE